MHAFRRTSLAAAGSLLVGLAGLALTPPAQAEEVATDTTTTATASTSDANPYGLAEGTTSTPSPVGAELAPLADDSVWADLLDAAVAGDASACTSPDLILWLSSYRGSNALMSFLNQYGVFDWALYEGLMRDSDRTFGVAGEQTDALLNEHKDLRRFWDVPSADIELQGLHASLFKDRARLSTFLQWWFGWSPATADHNAGVFMANIALLPRGADNPFLTFGAFAFSGLPSLGLAPKTLYGDALIEGLQVLGVGQTGINAAFAHEFGHHVQTRTGWASDGTPEGTRGHELGADAYGVYFLTHALGDALNAKKVLTAAKTMYNVGDCNTTSTGHHGTPAERYATSVWAANEANSEMPVNTVAGSVEFGERIRAALPEIIANN